MPPSQQCDRGGMKNLKWVLRNLEELVSGSALVVTIVTVVFNVAMRYIFRRSFNWAEELAAMGFAWVVFVGAAACYKRKMHIGIDALVSALPSRLQNSLVIAVDGFLVLVNAFLTYQSLIYSAHGWTRPLAVLRIPYTFVNVSASIGFGLMLMHSVIFLISDVAAARVAEGSAKE